MAKKIPKKDLIYTAQCPECHALKTNQLIFGNHYVWQNCIAIFEKQPKEKCFKCLQALQVTK